MNTELMNRIFSDGTPDQFKDGVANAIETALQFGDAVYSDFGEQLVFANTGDAVIIEDQLNFGEITEAFKDENGDTHLSSGSSESATQPNVTVPRVSGANGKLLKNTQPDVEDNVSNAITDSDLAGDGKNFSLTIDGFESPEEAQQFYSDIFDLEEENALYSEILDELEENSLTFSDDEVAGLSDMATKLYHDVERLQGNGDINLAFSILEDADTVRSYSVLAANEGHVTDDVIESCNAFSEYAVEAINEAVANSSVTETFSEMDEDSVNAYFSALDDVEASVVMDVIESGDYNTTFSDVEEIVDHVYSELELETPINVMYSEDPEYVDALFSNMTDQEYDQIMSALDEDPNLTFSDANGILEDLYTPMNVLYSDMDEYDLQDAADNMTTAEFRLFSNCITADDVEDTLTFSEYLDAVEELRDFSDDDALTLADNATELFSAYDVMMETGDVYLAEELHHYSMATLEDAERAFSAGHEVEDVIEACLQFADAAEEVASDPVANYKTEVETAVNNDGVIDNEERAHLDGLKSQLGISNEVAAKIESDALQAYKAANSKSLPKLNKDVAVDTQDKSEYYSDFTEENHLFSDTTSSVMDLNPCLTSPII